MKARYIVLGWIMSLALGVQARTFEAGERIYFNATPASAAWWMNDTQTNTVKLWGKLLAGSNEYWLEAQFYGTNNCYLEIPSDANVTSRDWKRLILYRCAYNNRNDVKNKTGEIDIDADYTISKNYIQNFYYGTYQEEANWWSLTLSPSDNPSAGTVDGISKELIEACISSSGDPLSLQPKLAGNPLTYDYDHSAAHAWFKWNGSSWVALDGQETSFHADNNLWGYEGGTKIGETIGAAGSHTYYFLWTEKKSMRRFVEVAVTKDCSPTCEITDFGVVTSHVNAHDSTYVLDGIVAFKDATGKTLRISVTDAKGEHHVDYVSPSTPLVFSLDNLYADGATGVTATATFLGTTYSATATFDAPNAIIGIHTSTMTPTYGQATTLTPSTDGADGFKWHDDNTTDHERTIPAYDFDTTIIYTYYEYEKAPEVGGNLIVNGDFSQAESYYGTINRTNTLTGSAIGDYNFWGKDVTSASDFYDLYKDGTQSLFGGFSIVTDANAFWKRYTKKIAAKANTHYALFDADNSGEKAAWRTETNAGQPNLKLAKGTNYMFSFWVANINNYGEMNNAAKLQFELSYSLDGGSTWKVEKLGNPIDLNDYPDNLWHQNSHVYVSAVTTDKVRISVKDLNTSSNPGGNDFALDDIKFQPISIVSQAIKNCERFVVKIYEPAITVQQPQITVTQTPACGNTDFTMQVKVSYSTLDNKFPVTLQLTDDIYGSLFATPITIDPAVNPNSITLTLPTATYAMLVADGKVHTLTAQLVRINGAGVDKGGQNSATYTAPGVPTIKAPVLSEMNMSCDKTTYDLQVATDYLAFKGAQLHYAWDGAEWTDADNPTLSYSPSTWQTATGKLKNLVADGLNHTLRVYSDTIIDCDYTFAVVNAPYMPQISAETAVVQPFVCTDATYQVKVTATIANSQAHNFVIEDWNGSKQVITTTATDTQAEYTFSYAWETPTTHAYKLYFVGAESCGNAHTPSFTAPAQLSCNVYRDTICEGDNYTDNGFNIIAPPIGEAVHVNAAKDTLYLLVADGHSMYSKWTDVLFIDNSDGSIVAYQWYENGALLPGETQQRLYNPAGLSGSYYCVMTKTDGTKISTCEKAFDKVTPSRTASSAPGAAVVRKVRVSEHVYIIQENTGDEIRTRKILTPYE